MYCVKSESGSAVCRGCLSTDRRLSPLANFDLYFTLLNDQQKLEALKSPALLLCWECTASLRRMKLFQTQVRNAHRLLEELVDELPIKGLSQLSVTHKQDYDIIIKEVLDNEEPLIEIKEEKTKVQELNDKINQDDSHDFDDNDDLETNAESGDETIVNNKEEATNIPLKKSKRKLTNAVRLKTKIKIKKIENETNNKKETSNRKSLRSSGDVPIVYLKPKKSKLREFKQPIRKNKLPSCKNPSQVMIKVKKEKTDSNIRKEKSEEIISVKPRNSNVNILNIDTDKIATEKSSKNTYNDKVETDPEPAVKTALRNPKETIEIEIDCNKINDDLNDDSDTDTDDGDADFTDTEVRQNIPPKVKTIGVATRDRFLNCVCIRFNIIDDLDKYFTHVELSTEELREILDNEVSYENEDQQYGCKYCGLCYQMKKTLVHHMNTRHKQISKCANPVYLMYQCNVCRFVIRKEHTEAHMKYMHRWRYYCKECDKDFWDKAEGKSHFKEVHAALKCELCPKVKSTKRAMEAHMRERHIPLPCDACGKQMGGKHYLRQHKRYKHRTDDSAPEQRYCVTCDKQFVTVNAYELHIRYSLIHNGKGEERVACPVCGKLLRDKWSVQNHYDRFHSDKTRFQCPHCDKYYARKSGLQFHIDRVHLNKKPPKDKLCSICGRGFSSTRILRHHTRTHTGERPHACPHCPAAFAQPYPLSKHLATQHAASGPGGAPATQA